MHRRIHRLFADTFLEGLNAAPANSPLNDQSLVTTVEIVLFRDGRIHRLGVARTSGNMAFDVGALNSVRRAAPFGSAPDSIVSGDGNVYVRWAFHRDNNACGTWNAEPYILPNPGGPAPTGPTPTPGPTPRDEHPPRAPSTMGQREPTTPVRGGVSSVSVEGLPAGARVASR
jgi:TonB family protein